MVLARGAGRAGVVLGAALFAGACHRPIYDIDRMADPVDKARYSCQYLLERELAPVGVRDADGVLRRRMADFAAPTVTRVGDRVRITWGPGAITARSDSRQHSGSCEMTLRLQGRQVESAVLDGRPLHAGFGM